MSDSYDIYIRAIADRLIRYDYGPDYSLYNGKAGHALFFALAFGHCNEDRYFDEYATSIREILSAINLSPMDSTLGNGLAGVGWLFQRLSERELISNLDENFFVSIDEVLARSLDDDISNSNFDLIQGLIGKGIYFLTRRETPEVINCLKKISLSILSLAEVDEHGLKWRTKDNTYNLGLAHGIASVIIFLSKVNKRGIMPEETFEGIKRGTSSLVHLHNKAPYSRLAWCNGDLPVALALFRSSDIIHSTEVRQRAIDIVSSSISRKIEQSGVEVENSQIADSAFCHGTAGLIHLYNLFYEETQINDFKDACSYWLNHTLRGDELKTCFDYGDRVVWKFNGSVLQGATGTGLVLLSLVDKHAKLFEEIFLCD